MKVLLGVFLGATCVWLWAQYEFAQFRGAVGRAQADAAYARESEQALLSHGRWVRTIDAKTGISTYRFARKGEQR